MRVALVRGPQLSAYEMQTYEPLRALGHDLVAFTSKSPLVEVPQGIEVRRLPSPMDRIQRAKGPVRMGLEALAYRRGTANRLEGLEDALAGFDVLHAMETFNAFTSQTLDAARRHGKPCVVTVWENIPFLPVEPAFQRVRERVLREADAFVAVTERAKGALLVEGAPPERVHVVPVGIDLARFAPRARSEALRARLGVPPEALVLLFAARLAPEKGLLDVLHALRLLDAQGGLPAPPHLVVVGQGEQRAEAEARARALGIQDRVHFLGAVPYAEMPSLYRGADALVLGSVPTPRWQEQFGMVLVEAMAIGLPVVTSSSGSIPEVVGDAALLFTPNDFWSLADALREAHDPALRVRLAERGVARARERFDREEAARRLSGLYADLTRS